LILKGKERTLGDSRTRDILIFKNLDVAKCRRIVTHTAGNPVAKENTNKKSTGADKLKPLSQLGFSNTH
jgi:hypothetical protein